MNNLKKILGVIVTIFVFIGTSFVVISNYIKRLFIEAPQEAIQYNQAKVVDMINAQLEGIDVEKIRLKKDLILEKTIFELQEIIANGQLTYTELTVFYLDRIRLLDQKEKGLNAIAEVNPKAVEIAKECDKNKDLFAEKTVLYGMPVTLKDNINTVDMPTSAGTYMLKDFVPVKDAKIVENLKNAGAIVLAKVNLSELANFVDYKTPSGYSSKVGQTRNPFAPLELSPLGSSSGSAVSVTSNIGVLSIGTETTGSIVAPAIMQSVVGMKPYVNSISREGVFPLSLTMDSVGPIAKTVTDTIHGYNAIVDDEKLKVEVASLNKDYLRGKRIGIIQTSNPNIASLKIVLEKSGATVIEIKFDINGINNLDIITNDFKFDFNNFVKKNALPVADLQELINFNKSDMYRRARYGQVHLENSNAIKENNVQGVKRQVELAGNRLDALRERYDLDAFVTMNYDDVALPAAAGHPYIAVPFGMDDNAVPQGVIFISGEHEEKEVFYFGYAFEQKTNGRVVPESTL